MENAYFRILQHTNQCELVFPLRITNENSEIIYEQDIHAVRGCTDNIQSLLEHTKRKINKILETKVSLQLEINASLSANGVEVDGEINCKVFIEKLKKNVILKLHQQTFKVILNAPLVQVITLPVMLYVGYSLQPTKFKAIYTDKKICDFIWSVSLDQITWTEVAYAFKYKPTTNDLNKFLKFRCIPKNSHAEGPLLDVVSKMTVSEMCSLPYCPFEERHKLTQNKLSHKELRIVSYNTLSDLYSDSNSQFPYCSSQGLSIDYRKQLILKELSGYNADVICLQEVDHHVFYSYFKPKLAKTYKGLFHKKGNRVPEGLACFFNQERFKLLESKQLVFSGEIRTNNLFRRIWNLIKQSDSIKDCFIKQPTSLQVTVLKSKEVNELLIVANTHLYYHSEANDIRLLQTNIALEYIKDVCNKYKRTNRSRISVIFCGDFNSVPTSAVYDFLVRGVVQHTFDIDKENPIRNICLNQPFQFKSAYGTPKYTNFTDDFKGCLDYIFYESERLSVSECIPFPDEAVLSESVAIPSEVFPSDHIALVANLKWL